MNNKGFAKYEVLTVVAVMIILLAIGFNFIINSANKQKFKTMRSSAQSFANAVAGDTDGFNVYFNEHYLSEVLDASSNNLNHSFSTKSFFFSSFFIT